MQHLRLKSKDERRLLRGHLWVYRNEIAELPSLEDGQIVDLFSDSRRFIGRGFYQAQGGIAVRILDRRQSLIDGPFLSGRLEAAHAFRERLFPGETVYRWIFGESDGLPGLVADRYGDVVAAATSCMFYKSRMDLLVESFMAHEGIKGVRVAIGNEVFRYGVVAPVVECVVDGLRLTADLEKGQKTGLFLDQRENARATGRYARDARVLDGHCYIGLWSCHAAAAGARHVRGVDTSKPAIELSMQNARLNELERVCTFEAADILEVLKRGGEYDLVILDPPAFAKARSQEHKALGLYQALNRAAMEVLSPGGVLVTSSCSHFVGREAFLESLKRAAASVHRRAWLLDVRGPAADHPTLTAMPETAYLTCTTLRIL
jgi:23S rRNA (cytosine1962-C5)-methyltransferase